MPRAKIIFGRKQFKVPKYRNTKTDGFDSKLEKKRWDDLRLLESQGEIKNLQRQVTFELQPGFMYQGKKIQPIKYVADFFYEEKGRLIVEDAKGFATPVALLKIKMFKYKYPDISFTLIK